MNNLVFLGSFIKKCFLGFLSQCNEQANIYSTSGHVSDFYLDRAAVRELAPGKVQCLSCPPASSRGCRHVRVLLGEQNDTDALVEDIGSSESECDVETGSMNRVGLMLALTPCSLIRAGIDINMYTGHIRNNSSLWTPLERLRLEGESQSPQGSMGSRKRSLLFSRDMCMRLHRAMLQLRLEMPCVWLRMELIP